MQSVIFKSFQKICKLISLTQYIAQIAFLPHHHPYLISMTKLNKLRWEKKNCGEMNTIGKYTKKKRETHLSVWHLLTKA